MMSEPKFGICNLDRFDWAINFLRMIHSVFSAETRKSHQFVPTITTRPLLAKLWRLEPIWVNQLNLTETASVVTIFYLLECDPFVVLSFKVLHFLQSFIIRVFEPYAFVTWWLKQIDVDRRLSFSEGLNLPNQETLKLIFGDEILWSLR